MTERATRHGVGRRALATPLVGFALVVAGATVAVAPPSSAAPSADDDTRLYLVTLTGPGTSAATSTLAGSVRSLWMRKAQDEVLASVDAGRPTYRWTTALSGLAVELTGDQADRLATDPRVALVEPDRMLHLAGTAATAPAGPVRTTGARRSGGAGTVIGFVDSGITPEDPVFAGVPSLGPTPARFAGGCRTSSDWPVSACSPKLVGAQWFLDGFGADRLRDASSLSARDDDGHGTAVASVAAGNRGLVARVRGQRLGSFGGVAPQARVAAYKACWTAPDPDDDGCASSDVVAAIDRATADGVDVLNVSVAGDTRRDPAQDTVQRALLGAAEADIVVVAAAGNGPGPVAYAAPWVTTVGAVTGEVRRGLVVRRGERPLRGVMVADRPVGPARLVRGADVAAVGSDVQSARLCVPGSLDAAAVADRIVLCDRGEVSRAAKSFAVRQADGSGMVLANLRAGSLDPDLHAVPTVHVEAREGHELERWLDRHPAGRVTLRPDGVDRTVPRLARWSRTADVRTGLVTPDALGIGAGVLAAGLPDQGGSRWQLVSGTSVAAAQVSGAAAVIRSEHAWSAPLVRSALAGTALRVAGSLGAGLVRPDLASAAGLGVDIADTDYRAWLDARRTELGTASLVLDGDRRTATRTVTNLTRRARAFTARVVGLTGLRLSPVGLLLAPGESATVTIRVVGPLPGRDVGVVEWRSESTPVTRWPVVVVRR